VNEYISVLKNYANFSGRATRKEYWMFFLINFLISIAVSIVASLGHISFLSSLYTLAVTVPSLAVGTRRLHDIGRSGWWFLIGLIPLIGTIILIVFLATKSQSGKNQYGASSK
jgi:uncharacterized membrane protein YhaH (DUF805 family)